MRDHVYANDHDSPRRKSVLHGARLIRRQPVQRLVNAYIPANQFSLSSFESAFSEGGVWFEILTRNLLLIPDESDSRWTALWGERICQALLTIVNARDLYFSDLDVVGFEIFAQLFLFFPIVSWLIAISRICDITHLQRRYLYLELSLGNFQSGLI